MRYYRFRDQDPIVRETLKLLNGTSFAQVANDLKAGGGETVAAGTLSNWRTKKTKRPQFCKIAAVGAAAGKELVWRTKR